MVLQDVGPAPRSRTQYVFVIDRSPVSVKLTDGMIETEDATGGAGKVVAGDAAAMLAEGHDVHVIAVAKTEYEKHLARHRQPFLYEYMPGQFVTFHFANVPDDDYKRARDEAFSNGLWWDQQEQDHPVIRPETQWAQIGSYERANVHVTDVVDRVCRKGARVFVHDSHVARVGLELRKRGRHDLNLCYVHHAAMHRERFLRRSSSA